nr:unnamed protein product [Naegleria fowleri]
MVFVRSSRGVGALSDFRYKLSRGIIVVFQILLGILTLGVTVLTNGSGALIAALGENTPVIHNLEVAVFVVSAIVFAFLIHFVFGILYVNGWMMMKVLKAGELRARNMITTHLYTFHHDDLHDKDDLENSQHMDLSIHDRPDTSSLPTSQRDHSAELQQHYSGEQLKIVQMKQQALKRVIQIILGVTACMGLQFIGVCFIPLYFLNVFLAFGFYVPFNLSIVGLVIMFLRIEKRVREMQKLFEKKNMKEQEKKQTVNSPLSDGRKNE